MTDKNLENVKKVLTGPGPSTCPGPVLAGANGKQRVSCKPATYGNTLETILKAFNKRTTGRSAVGASEAWISYFSQKLEVNIDLFKLRDKLLFYFIDSTL